MPPLFLWPAPRFKWTSVFGSASIPELEARLCAPFAGVEAVLFSSGRSSIAAVLEYYRITRSDFVAYPPYSSHCVLEAIARSGSPRPDSESGARLQLIYHQWGFQNLTRAAGIVLEDSADSLFVPGPMEFPNGGEIQMVSLPKVFGCSSGAVLYCRNLQAAEVLREIRSRRKKGRRLQHLLRIAGASHPRLYEIWAGTEAGRGSPAPLLCSELDRALRSWEAIIRDRTLKWNAMQSAFPGLPDCGADRLPCAIPLAKNDENLENVRRVGLDIGIRHWVSRGEPPRQVIPVPIHQEVPVERIEKLVEYARNS